jgi:tetratricopeptide (TPR) repeat protein
MIRRLTTLGLAAGALLLLAPASAAAPTRDGEASLELWDDPAFQKAFTYSFAPNSELEPEVSPAEQETLNEILPLMQGGRSEKAIAALEAVLNPPAPDQGKKKKKKKAEPELEAEEPSAVFDFILANIYFQDDRLEEAADWYESAIEKFRSYRRAHKNLGFVYVRLGRFEKAITALSEVVRLGGADGTVFGLLGFSYSNTGQYLSAESAYRNARLLQPEILDWKLGLALSVFKQRRYAEAVTLTQALLDEYPNNTDYWMLQANAYIGLDEPLKAAENFEILSRMGKDTAATQETLGSIYVNEGLYELAARAYGRAVELGEGQSPERPLRWVEFLSQRGALEEARTLLARVKARHDSGLDAADRTRLLKVEARLAMAEGGSAEAVGVLEEIVALDPLDGDALIMLGQHYAGADEPDRAIFFLERAESLEDFEAEARVRHAQVLVSQARYREAVPLLKRAQELEPRDDVARYLEQVERVARSQR